MLPATVITSEASVIIESTRKGSVKENLGMVPGVPPVKEAQPGHSLWRRLDPTRDRGQRRPHHDGGRQEEKRTKDRAHHDARHARPTDRRIQPADVRQEPKDEKPEEPYAGLQRGVHGERVSA